MATPDGRPLEGRLLEGRVAVVTGAGHGIGRGHALELAAQGAKVVVNDIGGSVTGEGTGKDADLTVDLIAERGGEAVGNYADVADMAGAEAMIAQAFDAYGRLDVLVNNAGIVRDSAIWNMSEGDFDAVMRVHVKGTWAPCHHAARHWRARAKAGERFIGRIINTTSGAGLVGNFGQTNYATAKAAIAGLTQTLSLELHKLGVTVNCVGPAAATRITATMPGAPAVIEADDVPAGEWNRMDPSVSSPLVAWLASDESQLVTGQVIRAVAEDIILMQGWHDGPSISNDGQRWDAATLGQRLATDVFHTRAPGLRF
ncbi:SDR family oxidoreductase [soil metagenome]